MEHAAENGEAGAAPSCAVDQSSEMAADVRALLEQEARQFRRGRRLYLRLLLAYAGLACAFIGFTAPTLYRHVQGTSNRIDPSSRSKVLMMDGFRHEIEAAE